MIVGHSRLVFLLICSLLLNDGLLIAGQDTNVTKPEPNHPSLKPAACPNPKSCAGGDTSGSEKDGELNVGENTQLGVKVISIYSPLGCSDGSTICENVDNYPNFEVGKLLKQGDVSRDDFFEDVIHDEYDDRGIERSLCDVEVNVLYPKQGKSKSGYLKYIAQNEADGLKQGVYIETCRLENGPCHVNLHCMSNEYDTKCIQKYRFRRLVTLETNGTLSYDYFKIPSHCECGYCVKPYS